MPRVLVKGPVSQAGLTRAADAGLHYASHGQRHRALACAVPGFALTLPRIRETVSRSIDRQPWGGLWRRRRVARGS